MNCCVSAVPASGRPRLHASTFNNNNAATDATINGVDSTGPREVVHAPCYELSVLHGLPMNNGPASMTGPGRSAMTFAILST
jgi:hypothetical protein